MAKLSLNQSVSTVFLDALKYVFSYFVACGALAIVLSFLGLPVARHPLSRLFYTYDAFVIAVELTWRYALVLGIALVAIHWFLVRFPEDRRNKIFLAVCLAVPIILVGHYLSWSYAQDLDLVTLNPAYETSIDAFLGRDVAFIFGYSFVLITTSLTFYFISARRRSTSKE